MRSIERWCAIAHLRISRFPDAQLRICGLVLTDHSGMTESGRALFQTAGRQTQRHALAARCARVGTSNRPPGGRGECRVPAAPIAPCAKNKAHECSRYRSAGIARHSRTRVVLTAYFEFSPVIGLSCHRHPRDAECVFASLNISVEMSGPHDLAVHEQRASSCAPPRPPHPASHVRDDRDTPLYWSETAALMK